MTSLVLGRLWSADLPLWYFKCCQLSGVRLYKYSSGRGECAKSSGGDKFICGKAIPSNFGDIYCIIYIHSGGNSSFIAQSSFPIVENGPDQADCKKVYGRQSTTQAAGHQGSPQVCTSNRRSEEASQVQTQSRRPWRQFYVVWLAQNMYTALG